MKRVLATSLTLIRARACVRLALLTALVALVSVFIGVANASATNGRVLILDSMVSGGASSPEAQAAIAAGKGVDVVDDATWSAMTTAQFAAYDALILGDPTCGFISSAAEANALVWGAAVNGNVIIIGTDPVFHLSQGGGTLTNSGVAFAVSASGKTGAYITLTCHYHGTSPLTPVPLLDALGTFTVTGVGCFNDAHIVATHPALTGLTDAALSNWSCSVHEAFDTIAPGFLPLAIARGDHPGAIDFPDGSRGTPYIVARGVRPITNIELSPDSATNPVGGSHTLTATVKENNVPIVGTTVTFTVLSGPHAGTTGTAVTGASGNAQFTYTGTSMGMDTIEASYVDSTGTTRKSNQVTKTWTPVTVPRLDHFKCYKTKQVGTTFDPRQVVLTDQFNTERVNVVRPEAFCNPVDKNGEGISDPAAHLTCYKIRDVRGDEFPKFDERRVEVTDQFGTRTLLVKKVRTLCLPSSKSAVGQVPAPPPTSLDHFKCYKTKQVGTTFDPRQVVLTDQFNTERVNVVRPEAFCNPVDKNGGGIRNPTAHLTCYKIRDVRGDEFPKFEKRRVEVNDQFGTRTLLLKKIRTLCVPSSKKVI
jgi:Bacterial Ig-like domain (group 1)